MQGRAKILGHPIHQALIVFPLGLLATSVVFDIVRLATGNMFFSQVSYWMIVSGLIGGALAALPGLIDFLAIPKNTRARRIGVVHGLGNVVVLTLFFISFLLRHRDVTDLNAFGFSIAGFALAGITGWLGGELVTRLSVGVEKGAHPDSPSSLSDRPTSEHATSSL
jgi:uncharacterized membrane protein